MFNYRNFKKIMNERGHKVEKKGQYITVCPNNGNEGFEYFEDVIDGFNDSLKMLWCDHYNTHIYSIKLKII